MFGFLAPILMFLIYAVPISIVAVPLLVTQSAVFRLAWLCVSPFVFSLAYILISGGSAFMFRRAIIAGTFPRDLKHPVYGARRLYGLCWTAVFYFKPLYHLCLSIKLFKKILFRLFGYKGKLSFTTYPDTWIRDMALLNFGDNVYLSNRATLGTNIVLKNNLILVDGITLEDGALVGHLSMVGPGSHISKGGEICMNVAFGIRSRLEENAKVSPSSSVNHGTIIGMNSEVGTMSYVGIKCVIRENIKIAAGANIPSGTIINNQEDADKLFSSENLALTAHKESLLADFQKVS